MESENSKPRKRGQLIEQIEDDKIKAITEIVKGAMDSNCLTIKEFADLEPKVSLSTINNLLSPKYAKIPKPKTLRMLAQKIASLSKSDDAEDIYREMLEKTGGNIIEQPFVQTEQELAPVYIQRKIGNQLNSELTKILKANKINAYLQHEAVLLGTPRPIYNPLPSYRYDMIADFTNSTAYPIDYWIFEIITENYLYRNLSSVVFEMLLDSTPRTKFSFVTIDKKMYDQFVNELRFAALNAYVSVILLCGNTFEETYIETNKDHNDLDEIGLSVSP